MTLAQSWTFSFALAGLGFGLGLVIAAGRPPRPVYIVGTVAVLIATIVFLADFSTLFPH